MKKIYTGISLVGIIVGVVVWALTNLVSTEALTAKVTSITENSELKYYSKESGVKLETKVESLEETLSKIAPQLSTQNEMLIKILVQQEITIQRLQALERTTSQVAKSNHP